MSSTAASPSERLWTSFALVLYTVTIARNIVLQTYRLGLRYLVRKLSFLTWESTLLTHAYLSLKLLSPNCPSAATRHKLFLVCLSMNSIVTVAYWSLYAVDPKLVDTTDYSQWDVEWATTLFSHGGSLACLVVEGYFLRKDFIAPGFLWFLQVEALYTIAYCGVQKACRWYTGEAIYGFLDSMTVAQVCGFYLALSVVSLTVKRVATGLLSVKTKKE